MLRPATKIKMVHGVAAKRAGKNAIPWPVFCRSHGSAQAENPAPPGPPAGRLAK